MSEHPHTFDVELELSDNEKLGISVIKEKNGWLVQKVNAGPIEAWNMLQSDDVVDVGCRILSANGTPLLRGMEASDYSIDGKLLLCVSKAQTVVVEGRIGIIIWDAGRVDPSFVKVRWIDDGTENGLLRQNDQWVFISRKITDTFIGEPAVVDLSNRKLGDEGADQVASILESSKLSVLALSLNNNNIRDHGAKRLAEAIVSSDVMQMDLFTNFFSKELRDNIEELLYFRNKRMMLVTVYGVREGGRIQLSFALMSGCAVFESLDMSPSDTIRNLRKTLEKKAEAHKRHLILLLPAPSNRELKDSEAIAQVVLR